jgi:predicted phage tail protein
MAENIKKLPALPQGAGGFLGGMSGGSAPSDTLESVAFASFLDLLCEGEIQGLVNGVQSIYLNGVPVQETNGDDNFVGATIGWVDGTQSQPYIPGFANVQATQSFGVEVYNSVPITAQIDNPEANSVIITMGVGELSSTDQNSGDVSGTSAEMVVTYTPTGGQPIEVLDIVWNGYTSSPYQQSYSFPLSGTGPWTVTVTRITPDSFNTYLVNPTYLYAVTEVVDTPLSYPNSAIVGFSIDARQFSSIPSRAYLVQGMIIQVPNNYNPLTLAYSGVWDGGFQAAYSANPAWCLYDLLTSTRYGMGLYIDTSQVDTTSLYEIGQYCDELVPDGFGGTEPRFTLNTCITTAKGAYDLIQDICSNFRGMTYWGAGTILTTQDSPWQGAMPLFSPANVIGGQFTYSGSMRKDRHTVAYVTYNEPAQQYQQATEYCENPEALNRYGVRALNIMAVGCTSRGQAYRQGQWQLLSEQLDTDQLQFSAGMDAAQLTPGTIIQIADPVRAGERMGGRTLAGTVSSITLDAPVTLQLGETYTLYYMDATGTQQTVSVVNTGETTADLTFTTAAPAAPQVGFMWMLSGSNINPQLFRVINVQESAQNAYDVLAVTYNESKFDAIDFNTTLQIPPIGLSLGLTATTPTAWTITDTSYLIAPGTLGQQLVTGWSGTTAQYTYQWRVNGGAWQSTTLTTATYTIKSVTAGDIYDFQIYGNSVDGTTSAPLVETYTVPTLGAAPGAPTSLMASGGIGSVSLNWAAPSSLGLAYFQVYMATTNDLANAVIVGSNIGTTSWTVNGLIAGDTYYFWVNAVSTSGAVGPFNSTVGTDAEVLYIPPGAFSLGSILTEISTAGAITSAVIAADAIEQDNIAAQAVATVNIQNAAITTGLIADGAVTATQIQNASITTACIADAAITTALIADAAVGTAQIEYAAITSALIGTAAIGTAQIQDAAVTTISVADFAITSQAQWNMTEGQTVYYSSGGGILVAMLSAFVGETGGANQATYTTDLTLYVAGSAVTTLTGTGGGTAAGFGIIQPAAGSVAVTVSGSAAGGTVVIFEARR